MPQMNKGGKFIFGNHSFGRMEHCGFHRRQWKNITLQMKEKYIFLPEVRLPVASASPGKAFLHPSKLGHILDDTPPLLDYSAGSGEFIK